MSEDKDEHETPGSAGDPPATGEVAEPVDGRLGPDDEAEAASGSDDKAASGSDDEATSGPGDEASSEPDEADSDEAVPDPEGTAVQVEPGGAEGGPARRSPARLVAQLVLPVVMAAGAMGLHWWINVPEKIIESSRDQGSKKKKKRRNKKKGKQGSRKKGDEPRSAAEIDREFQRYRDREFEDEPTRASWARQHQALLNRAMVVARRAAFEGAPEEPQVVLDGAQCRSVRCRFRLRSSYPHELEVLSGALERMMAGDRPLWRSYESSSVPPPERAREGEHFFEVMVAFHSDETDARTLEVPGSADEAADAEAAGGARAAVDAEAAGGARAAADEARGG